ncbi:hypothetical protein DNX69_23745 [Rhodopseudomonas palustris]|uniref:Uncharacterized protein n=1 Tax=Rhodopseudomonas palustris TaxID=1076 RepID=A0A323UBE6_RHOPL|nr:hypothetical protein [Rhodopseudomonas palustris]PZA09553.1 hypothetical protein DNX69_23745 [Rhodopseudomonas palustris]
MPVMLQGTIAFEPEFVGNLAWLTRALIARDIDPDGVTIAKDAVGVATPPRTDGLCYVYSVSTGDTDFLVIESSDDRFLEKFLNHIEQADPAPALPAKGMFARLTRWMSPPA